MHVYHVVFIHSSVDGHLGCLHVLAIVSSAAVNAGVLVSICFFLKSLLNFSQYYFCFMFWFFGHETYGVLAPWPLMESAPPALEGEVLTTGLPGKSLSF